MNYFPDKIVILSHIRLKHFACFIKKHLEISLRLFPIDRLYEHNLITYGTCIGTGLHPKYDYETFIGGILLITREVFRKVDGLSNNYWGWGLEDDEFYARLRDANQSIERPKMITTGKKDTFKHFHSAQVYPMLLNHASPNKALANVLSANTPL